VTKSSESKWRALISEQERSGLSVREFADVHGITPTTLHWWVSARSTHLVGADFAGTIRWHDEVIRIEVARPDL
jgi:hypothetical protein